MPTPALSDPAASRIAAVWLVLGGLVAALTAILIACLLVESTDSAKSALADKIASYTLDLFKVIIGAVVGALGTTVGMRQASRQGYPGASHSGETPPRA